MRHFQCLRVMLGAALLGAGGAGWAWAQEQEIEVEVKPQATVESRVIVVPKKGERKVQIVRGNKSEQRKQIVVTAKNPTSWHLGVSESAVEARLHRARGRLRGELARMEVASLHH